jgi:hypothetical protein
MNQIAAAVTNRQEISFFDWMTKIAAYTQRPWIILIVSAAVAAMLADWLLKLHYTRLTVMAIRAIALLLCVYGLVLNYIRLRGPAIAGPSTAWAWMPSAGILLFILASGLRRIRVRRARERTRRVSDVAKDRIGILDQTYGAAHYVDQLTQSGQLVLPLLRSTINKKTGKLVFIVGPPGSGKTATLVRCAKSFRLASVGRRRPIVPIYVDMAAYERQFTDNPTLEYFIQTHFIRNDSPELNLGKAWAASDRYVDWMFLFDNSDEADLQQGEQGWSSEIIQSFMGRYSKSNIFYALVATRTGWENSEAPVVELDALTDDGWKEFLVSAGVNGDSMEAITADEGLYWFLKNPGTINLLTEVLVFRAWKTGDNVAEALGDAVKHYLSSSILTDPATVGSVLDTATATIRYLMTPSAGYQLAAPNDIAGKLADIGQLISLSSEEVDRNLEVLAHHGLIKRIRSRRGYFVEFNSASESYFCSCALRHDVGNTLLEEILRDELFRLTAIAFLQSVDGEQIPRYTREMSSLLDSAIDALDKDEIEALSEQVELAERAKRSQSVRRAQGMLAGRYERAARANAALLVIVAGLQNRPQFLSDELRSKCVEFARLIIPWSDPRTQVHLLAIRYAIELPKNVTVKPDPGLLSQNSQIVLDTASRIANTFTNTAEFTEEYRSRLAFVVLLVGLRSLSLSRERGNLPASIRLANDAGIAATVLYASIFGAGGLLQLFSYWRHPILQVCEVLLALAVAGPLAAARYLPSWRMRLLSTGFQATVKLAGLWLAAFGACWAFLNILVDLATFNLPLMPLLACYTLMWPAYVGFYLTSEANPSAANIIFPSPRIIRIIWQTQILKFFAS